MKQPLPGLSDKELEIFLLKQERASTYYYQSGEELRFELRTRKLLTEAAVALNQSGVQFSTFQDSRCNPRVWHRDEKGGFLLLPSVTPSEGIRNIYSEGTLYAFECATAIVIVLYKGLLESMGEALFNRWFGGLKLYDWHYDKDLYLVDDKRLAEALPGDVQYFKNPDVSPEFTEWQGENVLKLEQDLYYGHGLGVKSSEQIIESLNRKRVEGSTRSAYLTEIVVHPDYPVLYRRLIGGAGGALSQGGYQGYQGYPGHPGYPVRQAEAGLIRAVIGSRTYTA